MKKIQRALISVHDKTGIQELAKNLMQRGVEILATTGTAKVLEKSGVKTVEVASVTGMSELLEGRVKSLHPAILAPILAKRSEASQMDHLKPFGGKTIDLVIVNFMPFEPAADAPLGAALGGMDIGGPALARAAAKNFVDVAVLVDPSQYAGFIEEYGKNNGHLSDETGRRLALTALEKVAGYDIAVHDAFVKRLKPEERFHDAIFIKMRKSYDLRCGENPHQKAAFYKDAAQTGLSLADLTVIKGKPLSYNNLMDINTALEIVMEFDKCTVALVRHGVPTGVCMDKDSGRAYVKAREVNPSAAYGGVAAFNVQVEKKTARELCEKFVDIIVAPKFTDGALELLKSDKKTATMRIIQVAPRKLVPDTGRLSLHSMLGGVAVQEYDEHLLPPGGQLKVLSKRKPTRKQLTDMILAWKIVKHVPSNAAVLVRDLMTVGICSGQISRMDAVRIAIEKAGDAADGACLASDSFIAARSVLDSVARVGIVGIIEPGGAPNDDEIVLAVDEHNLSLAFTGMRHYSR